MPSATNPNAPEFYVYYLTVDRVPFYVGIGRAKRVHYRLAYIQNGMRTGKTNWSKHCEVAAQLIRAGHTVSYRLTTQGLIRAKAVERERSQIDRLLRRGLVLANIQHNPKRRNSPRAMARAIKVHLRTR